MTTFKKPYHLRDRVRPFMAGLLEGTPLVEVALEGLRRGPPDDLRREYESRILRGGSTEQIHAALLTGLGGESQDRMAIAFEHRFGLTRDSYRRKVESSESSMNGFALLQEGDRYVKDTIGQIKRMFASRMITSEKAQMELASMIYAHGSAEDATEIIAGGHATSQFARHVLRFKCGYQNGYEA